jgi:hypothetical protein
VGRNGIFKIIAHSEWGIALALPACLVRIDFGYDRDWGEAAGRAVAFAVFQRFQPAGQASRIVPGESCISRKPAGRARFCQRFPGARSVAAQRRRRRPRLPGGERRFSRLDQGRMGSVRTTAGQWNDFSMAINSRYPFSPERRVAGDAVVGVGEIQELRTRMAVEATENSIEPQLAQFLPERRELWVDHPTSEPRRLRMRLKVSDSGEKFLLVNVEEQATIATAAGTNSIPISHSTRSVMRSNSHTASINFRNERPRGTFSPRSLETRCCNRSVQKERMA